MHFEMVLARRVKCAICNEGCSQGQPFCFLGPNYRCRRAALVTASLIARNRARHGPFEAMAQHWTQALTHCESCQ